MFWTILYIFISYAFVSLVWRLYRAVTQGQARRVIGVALLAVPLLPYAIVAAQTALYGGAMRPDVRRAMLDTGMSEGDIRSLRVLSLTPRQAQVYVIEPCSDCCGWPSDPHPEDGQTVTPERAHDHWQLSGYDTVWSDCGSAEGNTFPPYPEAKEF